MGKTRSPYPQQFREQAVRLVRDSEKTVDQIAHQTLRNWVKQVDLDNGRRTGGLTTVIEGFYN